MFLLAFVVVIFISGVLYIMARVGLIRVKRRTFFSLDRIALNCLIIGSISLSISYFWVRRENENAQATVRKYLQLVQEKQEVYRSQNGAYAKKLSAIPIEIDSLYEVYLSEEEFPVNYRNAVSVEDYPYATNDDYQVFAVIRRLNNKPPQFFIQPKNGSLR